MYLNLKLRNFQDKGATIDSEKVDKELDKLKNVNSIQLLEYIKSSIEIIIKLKLEESENKNKSSKHGKNNLSGSSQVPEEYEEIIQKLEAEVRNHISVQQQMKLYIESYQSKIEELEKFENECDIMAKEITNIKSSNMKLEKELDSYRNIHKEK